MSRIEYDVVCSKIGVDEDKRLLFDGSIKKRFKALLDCLTYVMA